jgi:hypothetical protein
LSRRETDSKKLRDYGTGFGIHMTGQPKPRFPWLVTPIPQVIFVFVIWTVGFAVFLPTVNAARARIPGQPLVLAWLKPWYSSVRLWLFGFPVVATLTLTSLLLGLRALLPVTAKAYLPWNVPQRELPPKYESSRLAIAAWILVGTATVLLVVAALHIRSDRSHRRPVITWEGPLGPLAFYLACAGWLLSAVAAGVACYSAIRCESRYNRSVVWIPGLAVLNLFASCLFWAAVNED